MHKIFVFSIAVIFCVDIFISTAKEVGGNDVILSHKELKNHIKVDTTVNKEFHFNASELKVAQADECKCENGKCMRACDVEKNTPCDDQRKVCVCNPEFAKFDDGECRYCNCGVGINCTFTFLDTKSHTTAECVCPKDQYIKYYPDETKCFSKCSDERPCLNGGDCINNKCFCRLGTEGNLCKEVKGCRSKCENRLEVDCLYNEQHYMAYCNCKNSSLWFDKEANICKPCPCENGFCDYEYTYYDRKLICKCHPGYKNFNGFCKKCDCDLGGSECEFNSMGKQICNCQDSFYEREERCVPCGCIKYSTLDIKCNVTDNVKRCICNSGFQDVNGYCEDINECETDNPCHPSEKCYNKYGSFECRCPDGYKRPYGLIEDQIEVCEDINECAELTACNYWTNVECVNLPGSYKCECLPGNEPRSHTDEPRATECFEAKISLAPSVIVVSTALVLMAVSSMMHTLVKNRATRLN